MVSGSGGPDVQGWQVTFLGRQRLSGDLSAFELEAFFTFVVAERRVTAAGGSGG